MSTPLIVAFATTSITLAEEACGGDLAARVEATSELRALHERQAVDPDALAAVNALREAGRVCSAEDAFYAASVLGQGEGADLAAAVELARQAWEGGRKGAGWLLATTTDRLRVEEGRPQPYGTLTAHESGRVCIYPLDPEVGDAERLRLGARSAADTYERLLHRNSITAAATAEAVEGHGLLCATRAVEASAERFVAGEGARSRGGWSGERTLTNGEMWGHFAGWSGTAWTVEQGAVVIHPFLRSGYGVTSFLDVKTSPLGWLVGPNLGLEVAPVQTDGFAASIEVIGLSEWGFGYTYGRAILHTSTRLGPGLLNVNAFGAREGAALGGAAPVQRLSAGPEIGYDLHLGESAAVVFTGRLDAVALAAGEMDLGAGLLFVYASRKVGVSFGVNTAVFDTSQMPFDVGTLVDVPDAPTAALPLPHLQVWWKL